MTKKPLQVLNASAGSGKTYHLVKEYIRLLLSEETGFSAFSHIIAMTFTNKAALEMKERILKALDELASPHVRHPLSKDLADELGISETDVEVRSREILQQILHRYEEFHVMTIDKFNLKLIKSFGRELDLPHNFEVTLDESELIERIVDQLLDQLGTEGARDLNKLVLAYAKANIEDGNQWNFRRSLIDFGKILNSEKNQALVSRLLEMDFSPEQFGILRKQRTVVDLRFQNLAKQLGAVMDSENINSDQLPGKSTTYKKLVQLREITDFPMEAPLLSDTFIKYMEGDLKAGQHFPEAMKSVLREMVRFHEQQAEAYHSLVLFQKHFFNMSLLQFMAEALKNVRQNEQLIRISEFNTLISQLIQHESTPFIYERLGTKFHHFLLDEFQDTSRLQWLNMVPLVRESISQNKDNLIVGDPKQSIYRFKNGVAEQFVTLPAIYNPEKDPYIGEQSAYFEQMGAVRALDSNWRSAACIVGFNNAFFQEMRTHVPDEVANFYNSVEQIPRSNLPGAVFIYSQEGKKSADEILPQIIEWIEHCLADGFHPGDICILGNRNFECNRWAIGLTAAGYKVVSSESLLIRNSLPVQLTIAFLKRRLRHGSEHEIKRFAELFFRLKAGSFQEYKAYFVEKKTAEGKSYRRFDDDRFLDDYFGGEDAFYFKHESIYDLIQRFYQLLGFTELKDPYLHHLADFAFDFGLHRGPDLKLFLSEYESKKNKLAVQIPESPDALRIMTIHKSKGLEFPAVLIPSMNFTSDIKGEFLIDVDDFVVYKQPTKNEQIAVLQELYQKEREQIIADNMNKCYVAMTRPIERLYVGNDFDKNGFGALFHSTLEGLDYSVKTEERLEVSVNDGIRRPTPPNDRQRSAFVPTDIHEHLWFPHIALQDRAELYSEDYLSEEMQFGREFHLLASRIEHSDHIDAIMNQAIDQGEVCEQNRRNLHQELSKLLDSPAYQALFENALSILNEQDILVDATTIVRPDKIIVKAPETIIIDYKTGLPKDKHKKQVKDYQRVLESMKYPNVSCYLFYSSIPELRHIE